MKTEETGFATQPESAEVALARQQATETVELAAPEISLFDDDGKKKSPTTLLIDLCAEHDLFHDSELNGYAVLTEGGCRQIWLLESKAFRNWLANAYYRLTQHGIRGQNIDDALATLSAKARNEGPLRDVFTRVAWLDERIYIDLVDEKWRVVEIDSSGWRVLDASPVMFTRRAGMTALPMPETGDLNEFARIVNVAPDDLPLLFGWLLMAARGKGPFPILVLQGEQGTGKSTLTKRIRSLIDPSGVPLRGLTRDVRDLRVSASNNYVVVLDNLSGITPEISDTLCRFATGGGFAERQLYSNRDEVIVNIIRPVILNGIDEIATRGDLMERCLILNLQAIPDARRQDEANADKQFEEVRPALFGGMCTALATGLKNLPDTKLERKPRMADFCLWATACSPALGWAGNEFMAAYRRNQDSSTEMVLDSCPFTTTLIKFMDSRWRWSGTATDLLDELENHAPDRLKRFGPWPRTGKGVSNILKRMAPMLRRQGIEIMPLRREGSQGRRVFEVSKALNTSSESSVPSTASNGKPTYSDDREQKYCASCDDTVRVPSMASIRTGAGSGGTDSSDGTLQGSFPKRFVEVKV